MPKASGDIQVKTAILSVSDKSGLVDFAKGLRSFGISLLATGGTHSALKEGGVEVKSLGEAMGLSEALDGRVKTLHSNLFAGILAKRSDEGHVRELKAMGVSPIDMVVSNFYPFEKVTSDPTAADEVVIENIDIGGPSMVRASTKNHLYVTVVPSPRFYAPVLEELATKGGRVGLEMRRSLAVEAFAITSSYDAAIYNELRRRFSPGEAFPRRFVLSASKHQDAKIRGEPRPEGRDILHRRGQEHDGVEAALGRSALVQQLPRHRERLRHPRGLRGRPDRGDGEARTDQRVRVRSDNRQGIFARARVRPRGRLRGDRGREPPGRRRPLPA